MVKHLLMGAMVDPEPPPRLLGTPAVRCVALRTPPLSLAADELQAALSYGDVMLVDRHCSCSCFLSTWEVHRRGGAPNNSIRAE